MKQKFSSLCKPVLAEILVSAVLTLTLAFFMWKLDWNMQTVELGVSMICGIACFAGGVFASGIRGKRRFLTGLCYGFLFFMILLLIRAATGNTADAEWEKLLKRGLICALSGMAGGMFSGNIR